MIHFLGLIAGINGLTSDHKIKIVSLIESPIVFGTDAQILHDSKTEPKVRPPSEAMTYLINNGNFTKEEVTTVTPFLESARIEVLARRNEQGKWVCWNSDGHPVKGLKLVVPGSVAKDAKPEDVVALMVQTKVLPWTVGNFVTDDNSVILELSNYTSFLPKTKESWFVIHSPNDAYIDLPFTFNCVEPLLAKLPMHEGETAKLPNVQLTVAKIAPATKDQRTTNSVHVTMVGSQYPRQYQLSPAFTAKPSNENPNLKSWTLTDAENTWSSKRTFKLTVCSDAKFSDWHAINIGRKTTFSGFFGHVATRPN